MTPDEFRDAMQKHYDEAKRSEDYSNPHSAADNLMISVLYNLGYGDGCKIFQKMPKWYA
jgi:hypothetical protein